MKRKVILKDVLKDVELKNLTDKSHVGFVGDTHKWQIVYSNDRFNSVTGDYEHTDNCTWQMNYGNDSLVEAIKSAMGILIISEIYVFSNRKELYKWLSE